MDRFGRTFVAGANICIQQKHRPAPGGRWALILLLRVVFDLPQQLGEPLEFEQRATALVQGGEHQRRQRSAAYVLQKGRVVRAHVSKKCTADRATQGA